MKRIPSYSPILNLQTFNMFEVFASVGDYSQVFDFSCAAYKKVEIFNLLACLPKLCSFLGKSMDDFFESNDIHLGNEIFHLPKVILNLPTIVCTKNKFCKDDLGNITLVFVYFVELFLNTALTSEQENAGTCIEQVSIHSSTSKVFAVLAARISSTISSAERLSFHTPAKRLAQPLRGLATGSSECVMETLSKVMSSNFTLSLKSFSSDQYLALTGDGVANTFVFICSYSYLLDAANIHKTNETTK